MSTSKITLDIKADTAKAVGSLKNVESALDQITKKQSGLGNWAVGFSAIANVGNLAISAIKKVYSAGKELVDVYAIQEQAVTKLQSTLKATGNVVGTSAGEMLELASSLQSVTTYGDETILSVEQIMIATKAISKDALPEATELSLDMASALGTSVPEAAKKMAKALADPKSGLDSLKDANIIFSEAEKKTITQMVSDGKQLEAQQVILDKVSSTYGGIARDIASTDTGKLTQIKNVWGDIKEGLGQGLLDTISPALDWILKRLQDIARWSSDRFAEREMAEDLFDDPTGNVAGNKYSAQMLQKYWGKYANETADAYETLQDMNPNKDKNGNALNMDQFIADLQAAVNNKDGSVEAIEKLKLNALPDEVPSALREWESASAKTSSALLAWNIAVARESAPAVDAFSSSGSTSGSSSGNGGGGESPRTMDDFIKENSSLSKTAQVAAIDSKLSEAETWKQSVIYLGDENDTLNQIIKSLERQRAEISGVYTAEMALGDYQQARAADLSQLSTDSLDSLKTELTSAKQLADTSDLEMQGIEKAIETVDKTIASKTAETAASELSKYISSNASLSHSAQVAEKDSQIALAESFQESALATEAQKTQLQEIIDKLKEEKTALDGVAKTTTAVEDFADTWNNGLGSIVSGVQEVVSAFASLQDRLMQNEIDSLQAQLDSQSSAWDDYYSDLEEKHKTAENSLDAQYASGKISAEDYYASVQGLQDEDSAAKEKHEKEEEALQSKLNDLKKKQFVADKANSISQSLISGAVSIANIWATNGANPVLAGILTALSAATVAAQVAAIASQQYVPAMATGGIVTTPTMALIGEAGPEAVLPLNSHTAQRLGVSDASGDRITINVVVQNAYTAEDLGKSVFDSIQRLQKTGSLPSWRIA